MTTRNGHVLIPQTTRTKAQHRATRLKFLTIAISQKKVTSEASHFMLDCVNEITALDPNWSLSKLHQSC
jgi:hypothetical protein